MNLQTSLVSEFWIAPIHCFFDDVSKYSRMVRSFGSSKLHRASSILWSSSIGFTAVKKRIACPFWDTFLLGSIHFWLLNVFHSHFWCGEVQLPPQPQVSKHFSMERFWLCPNRIVVTAGRLETCDNLPLWFDSTAWNYPKSFIEFNSSVLTFHEFVNGAFVLFHDLLSIFVPRILRLVILQFSSFLPSRLYFVSDSEIILLVSTLFSSRFNPSVMGVLQFLSLSISLLLKLVDTNVRRSHLMFLLHEFRPCLMKQMIFVSIASGFPTFAGSANLKTEWTLFSKRFPDSLLWSLSENVFWLDSPWHEKTA